MKETNSTIGSNGRSGCVKNNNDSVALICLKICSVTVSFFPFVPTRAHHAAIFFFHKYKYRYNILHIAQMCVCIWRSHRRTDYRKNEIETEEF